jgi:aminoglycoside phosphotransferase (APT) family kinase protein
VTSVVSKPALEAFLRSQGQPSVLRVIDIEPLSGGYSRQMLRFTVETDGSRRRYVLRADRPAHEAMLQSDREVEWTLLSRLTASGATFMPPARWFAGDPAALGAKALIIDFVEGPTLLNALGSANEDDQLDLALALADLLADLHSHPTETIEDVVGTFASWDAYMDQLLAGFYEVERAHSEPNPFWRYLCSWLPAHRPVPGPLRLVHGDLNNSNILVADAGLKLVDWELARLGDPREDLGFYRTVASFIPPDLIGLAEDAFLVRYRQRTGFTEDVINPWTVGYFSLIASLRGFPKMLEGAAALSSGASRSIEAAYTISVQTCGHMLWMAATQTLAPTGGPANGPAA